MEPKRKAYSRLMGSIEIEEARDFWKETGPTDIQVFEDLSIKTRSIGFIWPEPPSRIVVENS